MAYQNPNRVEKVNSCSFSLFFHIFSGILLIYFTNMSSHLSIDTICVWNLVMRRLKPHSLAWAEFNLTSYDGRYSPDRPKRKRTRWFGGSSPTRSALFKTKIPWEADQSLIWSAATSSKLKTCCLDGNRLHKTISFPTWFSWEISFKTIC